MPALAPKTKVKALVKASPKRLKPAAIRTMFARLQQLDPDPRTELNYTNPFTLLVAVVLSAQMTDKGVNKATEGLFRVADTPQSILDLGLERLKPYLKAINFYNTKAQNVIKLSRQLVDNYGGEVPRDHKALESLAGVGRKTANVVMNEVFREPTLAVDTHVFRVANRTGLAPGKTVLQVELLLLKRVPRDFIVGAHHWLILHGRYTCVALKPKCGQCPIFDLCLYPDKDLYAMAAKPKQMRKEK